MEEKRSTQNGDEVVDEVVDQNPYGGHGGYRQRSSNIEMDVCEINYPLTVDCLMEGDQKDEISTIATETPNDPKSGKNEIIDQIGDSADQKQPKREDPSTHLLSPTKASTNAETNSNPPLTPTVIDFKKVENPIKQQPPQRYKETPIYINKLIGSIDPKSTKISNFSEEEILKLASNRAEIERILRHRCDRLKAYSSTFKSRSSIFLNLMSGFSTNFWDYYSEVNNKLIQLKLRLFSTLSEIGDKRADDVPSRKRGMSSKLASLAEGIQAFAMDDEVVVDDVEVDDGVVDDGDGDGGVEEGMEMVSGPGIGVDGGGDFGASGSELADSEEVVDPNTPADGGADLNSDSIDSKNSKKGENSKNGEIEEMEENQPNAGPQQDLLGLPDLPDLGLRKASSGFASINYKDVIQALPQKKKKDLNYEKRNSLFKYPELHSNRTQLLAAKGELKEKLSRVSDQTNQILARFDDLLSEFLLAYRDVNSNKYVFILRVVDFYLKLFTKIFSATMRGIQKNENPKRHNSNTETNLVVIEYKLCFAMQFFWGNLKKGIVAAIGSVIKNGLMFEVEDYVSVYETIKEYNELASEVYFRKEEYLVPGVILKRLEADKVVEAVNGNGMMLNVCLRDFIPNVYKRYLGKKIVEIKQQVRLENEQRERLEGVCDDGDTCDKPLVSETTPVGFNVDVPVEAKICNTNFLLFSEEFGSKYLSSSPLILATIRKAYLHTGKFLQEKILVFDIFGNLILFRRPLIDGTENAKLNDLLHGLAQIIIPVESAHMKVNKDGRLTVNYPYVNPSKKKVMGTLIVEIGSQQIGAEFLRVIDLYRKNQCAWAPI